MWKKTIQTALTGGVLLSMTALTACGGSTGASGGAADKGASPDGGAGVATGQSSGQVTLTLSVMTSNRLLELAKQKFEESHPNVKVDIKEYVAAPKPEGGNKVMVRAGAKPDPKDLEKFTTGVNTELMSGKGSDIIVTDGNFPYKKYADKKLLENLADQMKNDPSFKRDDYYTNVLDAMNYKSGLYALPAKLSLNMLHGNTAALANAKFDDKTWSWNDFRTAVEPLAKDANKDGLPDAYALAGTDAPALFALMVNSSFGKLVDTASKKFDTQTFTELLQLSKAMSDSKLVTSEKLDRANVLFQSANPLGYDDLIMVQQMKFDGKGTMYGLPTAADAKGLSFTSDTLLSINAKSAHKKEAWEFVKFMLSEDIQKSRELFGFAVNKKASRERQEQLKEIGSESNKNKMRLMIDGKEFSPTTPKQEDIDKIEGYLSSVRVYAETDPRVTSIIEQEAAPFFTGQKSAEEVAKTVQNKVNTYLQE
ncbi:ABC transporter substrate-binding protein [Paenibacillus flagellatus]|uniref:ABC transporter substrate-binding protein n=1 Tax=Paenibacillus flagellatus TaxID=2211139 RepID=A0A2V5K6Q5_9BACL|nr:extracellular solute-binding protein [Paenibacillus flagellatus]PYI55119.1 hypothetical protein DLM86_11365 [Paenibacillus flagellatus]